MAAQEHVDRIRKYLTSLENAIASREQYDAQIEMNGLYMTKVQIEKCAEKQRAVDKHKDAIIDYISDTL